ncbi:MAG: PorP/SprF family type IX secretion system membrane protein [Ferruginibacter sp.]|nr:PorP/SprF family type IX secretion system membrane protein [Ferruginibacter sp.]
MKNLLRYLFMFALLFIGKSSTAQQDMNFSQFYELPLLRNPALAGIFSGNIRVTSAYRNQWESVTTPYRSMAIGTEIKVFKGLSEGDFFTVGLQITNDIAGDSKLKRTQYLPAINYHKLLNEEHHTLLSLGFMGGAVSQSFDPTDLKFDDQFVGGSYNSSNVTGQTFNKTSFTYYDLSAGLCLSSYINENAKFYLGAGLFHVNKPTLSFMQNSTITLNKKYVFNAGVTITTSTNDKVVLYADHFSQGANKLTQGGFLYTHNLDRTGEEKGLSISGGMIYRYKDAMIPTVKLNTSKLSMGFSYDTNVSSLKTASNYRGGFEMTLSYLAFWKGEENEDVRTKCPANIW